MRKLQNNTGRLNFSLAWTHDNFAIRDNDRIRKNSPKQEASKNYGSNEVRHSRMPSEIIVKSLNRTICTKATPHIHNLFEENIQNL